MKLRTISIIAMCAVLLLLPACATGPLVTRAINAAISCEKFEKASHYRGGFEVEVGTKIRIDLCSNPTTGFEWDYEIIGEDIIEFTEHEFIEPEDDVMGAPGRDLWTFTATNTGEAEIRMEYSQPWAGGQKAEWKYTFFITVE